MENPTVLPGGASILDDDWLVFALMSVGAISPSDFDVDGLRCQTVETRAFGGLPDSSSLGDRVRAPRLDGGDSGLWTATFPRGADASSTYGFTPFDPQTVTMPPDWSAPETLDFEGTSLEYLDPARPHDPPVAVSYLDDLPPGMREQIGDRLRLHRPEVDLGERTADIEVDPAEIAAAAVYAGPGGPA